MNSSSLLLDFSAPAFTFRSFCLFFNLYFFTDILYETLLKYILYCFKHGFLLLFEDIYNSCLFWVPSKAVSIAYLYFFSLYGWPFLLVYMSHFVVVKNWAFQRISLNNSARETPPPLELLVAIYIACSINCLVTWMDYFSEVYFL